MRNTQIERPPAVVRGWGIREGGKVILTGMGGRGKSTLLLELACHLAAGTPFLQHQALEVAAPQNVAVLMAEDPLSEVKFRWEQQMMALGYGDDIARRIAFLAPQEGSLMLTDEYGRAVLFDALRQHQATIAFLDPLVSLHNQEENSNSAMRGVLDLLTPLQEETGCTFIIAHHEPKAPEGNSTAARGASSIRDWSRTMLRLTPQGTGPGGAQRFNLDLDKANYGGTVWNLTLERQQDSYLFKPIDLEAVVTPKDVRELLGPDGGWFGDVQAQIMEQLGVARATAYRGIKKAEKLKLVEIGARVHPDTKRKRSYLSRVAEQ